MTETPRQGVHVDWVTLVELHEGLLDATEEMLLRSHLETCEWCRSMYARLEEVTEPEQDEAAIPDLDDLPPAPDDIFALSMQLVDEHLSKDTKKQPKTPRKEAAPVVGDQAPAYRRWVKVGTKVLSRIANADWKLWRSDPEDPEIALERMQRTLGLLEKTGQSSLRNSVLATQVKFDLYVGIGNLLEVMERFLDAAEAKQQALFLARELGYAAEEGKLQREVGSLYFRTSDYQRALRSFERGLSLAQRHEDQREIYQNIRNIGCSLSRMGRVPEAAERFQKAVAVARDSKQMADMSGDLHNLSIAYRKMGALDDALAACDEALGLERSVGDTYSQALSLVNRSNILAEMGRHQDSLNSCNEALAVFRELGDERYVSVCLLNIADSLNALGHVAEALETAEEAVRLKERLQDTAGLVYALNELGRAQRALGRKVESLDTLRTSHGLATRLDSPEISALAKYQLATSYYNNGEYGAAHGYAKDAAALARSTGQHRLFLDGCALRAKVAVQLERFAELEGLYREAVRCLMERDNLLAVAESHPDLAMFTTDLEGFLNRAHAMKE